MYNDLNQDIKKVHHYFFTLAPDDKYIKYTMEKAMYLVDETGLAQYNTLKEKGFYSNILGTSAVFSIFCDSINFDKDKMEFTYYGRQRIERRTSILTRELVTTGSLKRVPRTDNNPHGLLITNWRTLLNKDINQKNKGMIYLLPNPYYRKNADDIQAERGWQPLLPTFQGKQLSLCVHSV